jgi:hypothetical protein
MHHHRLVVPLLLLLLLLAGILAAQPPYCRVLLLTGSVLYTDKLMLLVLLCPQRC